MFDRASSCGRLHRARRSRPAPSYATRRIRRSAWAALGRGARPARPAPPPAAALSDVPYAVGGGCTSVGRRCRTETEHRFASSAVGSRRSNMTGPGPADAPAS
ncbi:hypothetical protein EVAR_61809_1 [Eumeta japonica]|uniref:Uncharacterized protein n=1 Tax=Eumeta variegata TaxID=151549 RepID=A0A4C1YYH4_EUMVA|nr:hypothetical protein EVAR_61809_1 [Eumeta japonica]